MLLIEYDFIGADELVIGRIFKATKSPMGTPWTWTLAYGDHEDRTPTHGYEATRQAAVQAFARSWHAVAGALTLALDRRPLVAAQQTVRGRRNRASVNLKTRLAPRTDQKRSVTITGLGAGRGVKVNEQMRWPVVALNQFVIDFRSASSSDSTYLEAQ
jgi:hypothetical protein